jgi:tRNA pseudouridine55 synthase
MKSLLNGWLVLDKPYGMTSAHAVGKVKRLLKPGKIGHGGTLDPLASGILPLALGEATKLFQFVAANRKSYRFTVCWGEERSTDDLEGEVVRTSAYRPPTDEITSLLLRFTGNILQAPPAFSAIKIGGKRAYNLARAGETPSIPARPVHVESLTLLRATEQEAVFEMTCGKGTYVRSIARDLGREMGCLGHVTALRRLTVGKFHEKDAISLEKLEELVHSAPQNEWLLPLQSVLDDIPAIHLDHGGLGPTAAHRLAQGQKLSLPPHCRVEEAVPLQVLLDDRLIAIATAKGGLLKPVRVLLA